MGALARLAVALAAAWLPASCAGTDQGPDADPATASPVVAGGAPGFDPERFVSPALLPTFQALGSAVEAGDDELALRLTRRLRSMGPEGVALERLEAYERILEGRRLVATLDLRLVCEPVPEQPGLRRLRFKGSTGSGADLVLRCGSARLRFLLTAVDPRGIEQRWARSESVPELARLRLPARGALDLDLGQRDLPVGGFLAARGRWELHLASGEVIADGGEPLPARDVRIEPCESVHVAAFLPDQPVDPQELVRYVSRPGFGLPGMMERTVRIPSERRGEALDLLTPAVMEMNRLDLARLVPSLRWLTGLARMGGDIDAWRSWLQARARQQGERVAPGELDLPAPAVPGPATGPTVGDGEEGR